jgi:hypothetical protein
MPIGIYKHKPRPEEVRKKISESVLKRKQRLGYINSPETRKKQSEIRKGMKFTEEHKKKMSENRKYWKPILIKEMKDD